MTAGTPEAEVVVTETMVRALLCDQHSDLADQPLTTLESGWDNFIFRLGDDFTLRFPRRNAAADLILNEQRWLGQIAEALPVRVPAALRIGFPGHGYPWHWSVLPWLPGRAADENAPDPDQAIALACFLAALHRPAPADAPANAFRGCPLADRAESVTQRLARLRDQSTLIGSAVDEAWQSALDARLTSQNVWLHGDLHARNVLVDRGKISGIIDWGDITSGDPATDLASAWGLFENAAARRTLIDHYGPSEAMLRRTRGWAVAFGAILLDTGLVDNPRHAMMGELILRRLAEDDF